MYGTCQKRCRMLHSRESLGTRKKTWLERLILTMKRGLCGRSIMSTSLLKRRSRDELMRSELWSEGLVRGVLSVWCGGTGGRWRDRVGGVVCLSGYFPLAGETERLRKEQVGRAEEGEGG